MQQVHGGVAGGARTAGSVTPAVTGGWLNTALAEGTRAAFGGRQHGYQQSELARKVACGVLAAAPRLERVIDELIVAPHVPTWRITAVFDDASAHVRARREAIGGGDELPDFLDASQREQLLQGALDVRQMLACGCRTVGTLCATLTSIREYREALTVLERVTEREIAQRGRPTLMR